MAGGMVLVLTLTMSQMAWMGEQKAGKVQAAEDKETLTKTVNQVLESGNGQENGADDARISKEETVYVNADTSGKVTKTTVSEWLKNPGKGTVEDASGLEHIKNVKGNESFKQGEEDALNWKAEGKDIYYQGTTEKELPVGVQITYLMNGKEVSAKEFQGKSGKAEIRITYTNQSKGTADVEGEQVELYTPFTMITAMMLPTEEYTNVQIDNGKVISDADKNIVVGLGFPGLKENLDLQDVDVDIPSTVTITADVKDASVGPTITMASSEILEEFDLNKVQDFDSLEDSILQLGDAAGALTDGARALKEGTGTLNSKSGELQSGVNQLAGGIQAYTAGVGELAGGTGLLTAGAGSLKDGAGQVQAGIEQAKAGADQLAAGYTGDGQVPGMNDGIANLQSGLNELQKNLSSDQTLITEEEITEMVKTILMNAVQSGSIPSEDVEKYAKICQQSLTAVLGTVEGRVKGNMQQIQGAVGQLQTGADSLAAGNAKLYQGSLQLQGALAQLQAGNAEVAAGAGELYKGVLDLGNGAQKLQSNSASLNSGAAALQSGGVLLADGVSQLSDGANTLASGMSEFKTTGIDKLTQVFQGDIQKVTGRISAMTDLGKSYRSFGGAKEGMDGTTKFVIETAAVE